MTSPLGRHEQITLNGVQALDEKNTGRQHINISDNLMTDTDHHVNARPYQIGRLQQSRGKFPMSTFGGVSEVVEI
jgi:hypothetical protein